MPKIAQPRDGEPITLTFTSTGQPRYRVRLDVGRHPKTGRRVQERTTHETLTTARAHVTAHRTDRSRSQLVTLDRTNRQTFSEFADAWLTAREQSSKIRPNTAVGYRSALNRAAASFGGKRVAEVNEADVEAMLAEMRTAGLTLRSAQFTLFVVRAVFKHAVARKLVALNPATVEGVEAAGQPSKPHEALTPAQIGTLRTHLAAERDRLCAAPTAADRLRRDQFPADGLYACWLLTLCGLRRSEVLGLRWSDIDLTAPTLTIVRGRVDVGGRSVVEGRPKTARGARTLPLPADVVAALRSMRQAHLAAFGADQVRAGYLAVDKRGEALRPEVWTDQWRRHCAAAGVPAVTLHAARHSSVTAMRLAGVPDHIVAAWHGHDEVVMRRTYSVPNLDDLALAGTALQQAFAGLN